VLYVDDLLLAYDPAIGIQHVKRELQNQYRMIDMGPARRFLAIELSITGMGFQLSQTYYIDTVLRRFGLQDCNTVATPLDKHSLAQLQNPSELSEILNPGKTRLYQSIVGSIMYIMLGTRPDLAFTISVLSKFVTSPRAAHLTAAKRVLRYLKGTRNLTLQFRPTSVQPVGFSDSNWAGDQSNCKSTGGFVFMLGGGAVSWKSKKQNSIALSSLEAEYIAGSEAAKEAVWLRRLYQELSNTTVNRMQPTVINIDNLGAIKNAENPRFHNRTKHIDIRHHFIRDLIEKGDISVQHISTNENIADTLTKQLAIASLERHRAAMGLKER
jgi:hypothetical protein